MENMRHMMLIVKVLAEHFAGIEANVKETGNTVEIVIATKNKNDSALKYHNLYELYPDVARMIL